MISKLLKLPEDVVAQIQRLAQERAKQTGERSNFSAVVRELLRDALATQSKRKR